MSSVRNLALALGRRLIPLYRPVMPATIWLADRVAGNRSGVRLALIRFPMRVREPRTRAWMQRVFSFPLTARRRCPATVTLAGGAKMVVDGADVIERTILVTGVWEPNVSPVVTGLLTAGDNFVDVGANIGYYTLAAAPIVGPSGRVVAIEPASEAFEALTRNLDVSGLGYVETQRIAITDREGEAPLYLSPDQGNPASTTLSTMPLTTRSDGRPLEAHEGERDVEVVETHTLAAVLADLPTDVPTVIKIDVEGLEREALDGLAPLIVGRFGELAIVFELTPAWSGPGGLAWFDDYAAAHGFRVLRIPNDYDVGSLVVQRFTPPAPVERIPDERCDLLMVRGDALAARLAALSA